MNTQELIKHYLIQIVRDKYFVRLECEGFSSYYDMSGQRTCYLVQTYNHDKLETQMPMLLGLIRNEYVAFWIGHKETGKFYKEGQDHVYYRDINQNDCIIGQVCITEEMIKWGDIKLNSDGGGVIEFKHMKIFFRKS